MAKFIRYQLPAFLWAGLIFALSSISRLSAPSLGFELEDKVAHFLEYAILGYLIARALYYPKKENSFIKLGVIIGILYGLTDEFHQSLVPGRTADIGDVVADILGVLVAQVIFLKRYAIAKLLGRKNKVEVQ